MDLYKRAFKLAYLDPEKYNGKWILSPGQFHISLCALRCLGRAVEGSGLEESWVESGMYDTAVVSQILSGNHYSRVFECHQITLQALYDLWFESFFEENPKIYDEIKNVAVNLSNEYNMEHNVKLYHNELLKKIVELELANHMNIFDNKYNKYLMYRWARMYMQQVQNMLQFRRSTRLGLWNLHLASLEDMCVWFFAYNRLDYATHIPVCCAYA